jgi:predicted nuclease of predicted toxin-antitoxin system
MRFLVDAQLPRRLAHRFRDAGHDVLHTLDLSTGNRTTDDALIAQARREDRVLVTKDTDFVDAWTLRGTPRLFLLSVGNCTNAELEALVLPHLAAVASALEENGFVELTRTALVIRG